jgi:catechol 2,3-dioxygenase-like lactoylglutathione lyase family enzyme
MEIQALGYLGVGSGKLDDWSDFATGWLGMQVVDRGAGVRAFRMDDRKQRLVIDRALPEGERYFGWEVADAAALDALAARLERAGVAVRREPAALADQRFVRGLISFADPAGNRLEAFHGAQVADEPFRPGRSIAGFRTGPQGMATRCCWCRTRRQHSRSIATCLVSASAISCVSRSTPISCTSIRGTIPLRWCRRRSTACTI